ncbi:hypothetical protein [[Phormidium] sp. ETS-05]|nr:hypothetical protein [[Phormidium] sp. ETS-05]
MLKSYFLPKLFLVGNLFLASAIGLSANAQAEPIKLASNSYR